jgi:phosphoribosylanthranilate isomerase
MHVTRVKICGITREEDAAVAVELGADFVGLNFFRGPRRIDTEAGRRILASMRLQGSNGAVAVGLFGAENAVLAPERGAPALEGLHLRQIYGLVEHLAATARGSRGAAEYPDVWLPVQVSSRESIAGLRKMLENLRVAGLLLDAAEAGKHGGTGKSFDWHWIAEAEAAGELAGLPPVILAGGLTPENVGEAIRIARPYAVDVASGVEVDGKPGVKDRIKLRDFLQAAHSA